MCIFLMKSLYVMNRKLVTNLVCNTQFFSGYSQEKLHEMMSITKVSVASDFSNKRFSLLSLLRFK